MIKKYRFPISTGFRLYALEDIMYIQADNRYCHLYLSNSHVVKLSSSLKSIEELLAGKHFSRVHHSYLVNLQHVKEFIRKEGGYIIMTDDKCIILPRRKKVTFFSDLTRWEKEG